MMNQQKQENVVNETQPLAKDAARDLAMTGLKVTAVRTWVVNAGLRNWIFVRVETDRPGLYGWGEATLEWKTRAVVGAIDDLSPLLIGKDPRDIERLVQILHKHGFWKLGVIGTTAISGIEIALWDILGKCANMPVWRLLGGKVRDRVKVYTHLGMGNADAVYGSFEVETVVERALDVVQRGYRALKIVPIPYTHYTTEAWQIDQMRNLMEQLRAAVGPDIDIMVDFHGRPASVAAALQYIDALAPGRPLFVEEPVPPGNARLTKMVAERSSVPIASGERLVSRIEFDALFDVGAVSVAQPDLVHCGGFLEAKKIAARAETVGVSIAPHNPLGPIAGVAALHFDVATPNFIIQEEMSGAVPWFSEVVSSPIVMADGHWDVPSEALPGLGVDLNEAVANAHPFVQEPLLATEAMMRDGTPVDW